MGGWQPALHLCYVGLLSGFAFVLRRLMPIFSWSSVTALARPVSCGGSSRVELPVLFLAAFSPGAALGPGFAALAGWGAGADALRFPGPALQFAAHACPEWLTNHSITMPVCSLLRARVSLCKQCTGTRQSCRDPLNCRSNVSIRPRVGAVASQCLHRSALWQMPCRLDRSRRGIVREIFCSCDTAS